MPRERFATRIVQGNKETLERNRQIYDDVYEAICVYCDTNPGFECELGTLQDMCADHFAPDNVPLPLYMTECDNLNAFSEHIAETLGTDCYIAFRTTVDSGEAYPRFTLHVDASKIPSPVNKMLAAFLRRHRTTIVCILLVVLYFTYA